MKVLITGATGFVGKALVSELIRCNHSVVVLTRNIERAKIALGILPEFYRWEPNSELPPKEAFEDIDGVVNLLGESIASKRWTTHQKQRLLDSRVLGTKHLVQTTKLVAKKCSLFVSASAIGFYDHFQVGEKNEDSPNGNDFLATVCRSWEKAALEIESTLNIRLVRLRLGVVLGKNGGALQTMKRPFMLGLGAVLGTGKQWMNWVHLDDLVSVIIHSLNNQHYQGVYNVVSPNNVTNSQFSKTLAKKLNRPLLFKIPSFFLRLLLGGMASMILQGQKVVPKRLLEQGFSFKHVNLGDAI